MLSKEQAIKFANCLKNNYTIDFNDMTDFCDTVIKALEQQPCEDCISRQAVDHLCFEYLKPNTADNIAFYEHFCDLPPVTPTQRWIPVSERLPKEDGEYLLFGKIDEDEENYIFIGEYDSCGEQFGIWQERFDRTTLGCLGSKFFEYSSVVAWQPLPKPYEEKKGNKNND